MILFGASDPLFSYLCTSNATAEIMTQTEEVVRALQMLGGRAHLKNINVLAVKLIGNNTNAKTVEANIRRILNSTPSLFRHVEGMPKGWWELNSYQDELATMRQQNAELQAQLAEKDRIIEQLRQMPTEDQFVQRFVEKVKHLLKRQPKVVEEIRKLLNALGRLKEDENLDAWMEGTETPKSDAASAIREQTQTLKTAIEQPREIIQGDKNEFQAGAEQVRMDIPEGTDPAELARRIVSRRRKLE